MGDPARRLRSRLAGLGGGALRPLEEERGGERWSLFRDRHAADPEAFALSVARSLSDHPRWLDCRYLYDAEGSALFTRITREPEYYPTRAEAEILRTHAQRLRQLAGPTCLVELGAGTSEKTRTLLRAWRDAAESTPHYVPIDIDPSVVHASAVALTHEFPGLHVCALASSYENGLEVVADFSPMLLLFMGSTIGNLSPPEMERFLERVSATLSPGDGFLLGADLVKDPAVLESAYNDAAGHTEAFTRNLFVRMNRELGCRIPLDAVEHVAYWNARLERIEIFARFAREVEIALPTLGRSFRMAAGEMVMTEISRKFRLRALADDVARFGFRVEEALSDSQGRFGLLLFRRGPDRQRVPLRRRLAAELCQVRARTLELLEPVADRHWFERVRPEERTLAEQVARLAHLEERWLVRSAGGSAAPAEPGAKATTLRTLDAGGLRGELERVRRNALDTLERADLERGPALLRGGWIQRRAARHEARLQELLMETIAALGEPAYEPVHALVATAPLASTGPAMVRVPGGEFLQGTQRVPAAEDAEGPSFWAEVAGFQIDTTPVTNGRFLAFLEDGGYERRTLWSDEGWAWRREASVEHPARWQRSRDGWLERLCGRVETLVAGRPVQHVSYFEAEAFARWEGKRLPSEAEWEKAAAWNPERGSPQRWPWGEAPPTPALANLDALRLAPDPVGSHFGGRSFYGCHQMVGDVWEWTTSSFLPYPGFRARGHGPLRPRFSKALCVLRGGSWATSSRVASSTCRQGAVPWRREAFVGFRCAADA